MLNSRWVLAWPRTAKRLAVMALDVVLAVVATWIAYALRLDNTYYPVGQQWWVYGIAPMLAIPIFVRFGLYRAIFRYTGQAALVATGKAVALYALLLTFVLLWQQWLGVPRSLGLLQPIVFLLLVGASRACARFWLAGLAGQSLGKAGRLLIFGAGSAGAQTAAALGLARHYILVGFVDDDSSKNGRSINGVAVHSADKLLQLVHGEGITDILLAMPNATRERRNQIIESLQGLPVHVRTLPSMADLASGKVTVQDIHELDIEDLLGREPVQPNVALLAKDLAGQVVLVSGAGGSIGGELTRQIALQQPRQLLLLDHNEFGLYAIHQELEAICAAQQLQVELIPLLGSVTNPERLRAICETYRPATVYHAAAYKHVPMVEDNPGEGVRNNVFGTLNMAQAAAASGTKRFVLISTDKAVRPTNVMGATKRVAELVLQALADANTGTCFSMVRFGNVLGSSGSVVPLFRKQLATGGPLTVTHEEVTRYFMTIPEAAQLVLQAGAMGQGGDVFVLDMGQPVKIMDLARRMVQLSGLSVRDAAHPTGDIEIAVTGLRVGEKLYEELLIGDNPQLTAHPRIMKAHEPFMLWAALQQELQVLEDAANANDVAAIKAFMSQHVQGYQPA
ncbi:nucleoside-diphosphate sugar epimerase/dehydratase [Rhodoferax saidenbachensis]|uniref:polysaccharide biosynthesis protein n=1 Tax=Rhodoferax saidenbachensis TaxID=1484693 RepID=UPI00286AC283|nr:nucleoside-diphosphate sugar epimerase/dehydratase [Rhodoferax saidenbachensis]